MKRLLSIQLILILAVTLLPGQQPVRIAQLSQDPEYASLTTLHDELSQRESQVESRLDRTRGLFASDPQSRERHAAEILELEARLHTLRDSLETVSSHIATIETDWLASNPGATGDHAPSSSAAVDEEPYFIDNASLRKIFPAEQYSSLRRAQEGETLVAEALRALGKNHANLTEIDSVYRTVTKPEADSIYVSLTAVAQEGELLADTVWSVWSNAFETKVYLYNWLLDKTGQTEILTDMERQMLNVRRRIAELSDSDAQYMYPEIAAYPFQKSLVLKYETAIASALGLKQAEDSLRGVAADIMALDKYMLPALSLEERLFLDYSDIEIARPAKYNAANPIPETEIHERGTIYRLLLGAYTKRQPVSVFRGVHPMSVEQKPDRKYYYYAGGYQTFEEAELAVNKAKGFGFNNPRIVVWKDGHYSDGATDARASAPRTDSGGKEQRYRIEIGGADGGLAPGIREIVNAQAKGKEISRIVDAETGTVKFYIGSFDDRQTPESLVREMKIAEPDLDINIFSVP